MIIPCFNKYLITYVIAKRKTVTESFLPYISLNDTIIKITFNLSFLTAEDIMMNLFVLSSVSSFR